MAPPDFSKETFDGKPVEYASGAWVCGEKHEPGGFANMKVNNRAFVFKLKLQESLGGVKAGKECLFIFGLGKDGVIKGVKDLEQTTGLKAVALMCNGAGHHIQLKKWYDAFPKPFETWVCPTKVPQTKNGEAMMKEYPDRWMLVDNSTMDHHAYQLLKYFGSGDDMQVDCVLFNQMYGYKDSTSRSIGGLSDADSKPKMTSTYDMMFKSLPALLSDVSQPIDDIMFYHKPSHLLITGHHFQFVYTPRGYILPDEMKFTGGFFFEKILPKMYFPVEKYETGFGEGHHVRLRDFKVHSEQWAETFKWNFQFATSHHDPVTVCGPIDNAKIMNGDGGLKGHMQRSLEQSGELRGNPEGGSWLSWKSPNKIYNAQKNEPAWVEKYGEPPVLPMGGPGYDSHGFKK